MADHVSRMASGGLSTSFMMLLMNFLAWYPGRPEVSRMKGTSLTRGYRGITWAVGGTKSNGTWWSCCTSRAGRSRRPGGPAKREEHKTGAQKRERAKG